MKYSIKRQMMTVFVGLILFMIVVFMIVNGSFLEKYYISNKKSEFIKAYTMVQEGVVYMHMFLLHLQTVYNSA